LLAGAQGLTDVSEVDLEALACPFRGQRFASPRAFHDALMTRLKNDLLDAAQGNIDSPIKAALEVMRDTRALIKSVVDFGGLAPRSHDVDFINGYSPQSSSLAAGPPMFRTRQMLALMEAGILNVVGSELRTAVGNGPHYRLGSASVDGSEVSVRTLIDARIPMPDIRTDTSELTQRLLKQGLWTPFVNIEADQAFETGGVAVTEAPFHPLGHHGLPDRQLYVLGIPTEHPRWFMQAGSSRPGFWTDFVRDADAIAPDCLGPCVMPPAAGVSRADARSA
jgi:hypothetical protein